MSNSQSEQVLVGGGRFEYEALPQWERLPGGWSFYEAVSVATDSQGRVYVFNRGEHPVIVLERDGTFVRSWGEGQFQRSHGIWIGPDDMLYLTDDLDHTVRKFTPEGKLLLTLGTSGQASDTGCRDFDYRTITHGGPPFNFPCDLALNSAGEMFVADGYGNARVHKFAPDGRQLRSWGEPGSGPGQFNLPHGIGVDRSDRVFVADRENNRLQIFSPDGEFLTEWTDVVRPTEVFIDRDDVVYVTELGRRAGMFPWMKPDPQSTGGRVSLFDRDGQLLARWGGGDHPCSPGDFYTPHDIWVDAHGDVYVAQVPMSGGGNKGLIPADCPSLTKFVRR